MAAAHASEAVRAGDVFAGKYRIDRVIGQGGMGTVLAARHVEMGQDVAIKLLLPELAHEKHLVERFVREAKAAAKISGDHVARVFDVARLDDGTPYIVLELLDGIDLATCLEQRGPLPIDLTVDAIIHACDALHRAHSAGVIHRDVKPSNLFLTTLDDGAPRVKVLDFGISKLCDDDDNPTVTKTKDVFGSPLYMSPEQLRSSKDVDSRTDLWSLGVVLFELLTGHPPFFGESTMAIGGAILHSPPKSLHALRPDVTEALETVVMTCLEKDRAKRPASAADLALMLAPFGSHRGRAIAESLQRTTGKPAARISVTPTGVDDAERSGAAEADGGFGGRQPPNGIDSALTVPDSGAARTSVSSVRAIPEGAKPVERSNARFAAAGAATGVLLVMAVGLFVLRPFAAPAKSTTVPAPAESSTNATRDPLPIAPDLPPPSTASAGSTTAPSAVPRKTHAAHVSTPSAAPTPTPSPSPSPSHAPATPPTPTETWQHGRKGS